MDAFVKKFQPDIYEQWKAGKDTSPHPEYHTNPHERVLPAMNKRMSFKDRNPDLNVQEILDNPNIDNYIKAELTGSCFVSAEEEAAALIGELDETEKKTVLKSFYEDSTDEDEKPQKKRRKKHDPDYDDDWYETKGHKFISQDGKTVKKQREVKPRARRTLSPKLEDDGVTVKVPKKRQSAPAAIKSKTKETVVENSNAKRKMKPKK